MTSLAVIPEFTARAHTRSSASLLPKNGAPSSVLHSADHAATKTFVPGLTAHVIESTPGAFGGSYRVRYRLLKCDCDPYVQVTATRGQKRVRFQIGTV